MQDFKLSIENAISPLSSVSCDISSSLQTLDYGILRFHILIWLVIRIRVMPDAKLIEKALPVVVNFLEGLLFLGLQRNKIRLLSQPPKRNIFQLEVVVLNYCG